MNSAKTTQTICLFVLLQIPALRPLAKYFPAPFIPVFLASVLYSTMLLMMPPGWLVHLLGRKWLTWVITLAVSVVILAIYPWADGLKYIGRGSDNDDALILAGRALIEGRNPYQELTYFGNPISPGPGWVILTMPFTTTGLYPLLFPTIIAILIWVLRDANFEWTTINRFLLLFFSSLLVWELAVVGSDYPPFALLLLSVVLLLQRPHLGRIGIPWLVVLIGLLGTFRLPFVLLPALIGFVLMPASPHRALFITIGGSVVSLALHGAFYAANSYDYPPIHLLRDKTTDGFSIYGASLSILLLLLIGSVVVGKRKVWSPVSLIAIGLGAPWAIVSIAELIRVQGNFGDWGGASFLIIALPAILLWPIQQ